MSDAATLLLDLRDIREPLAPATSSPYLLGLAALLTVVLLVSAIAYFIWQGRTLNRSVQHEIERIKQENQPTALHRLAVLLRRVMHHIHGDSINQLENAQWLKCLDKTFATTYFSDGRGSVFGTALYHAPEVTDRETQQLCEDLHKLIGHIRIQPRK